MHHHVTLRNLASALLLASPAFAQVVPVIPYARTMDLLVTDTSFDGVWRLIDRNQDGDFNDPNEAVAYYDETIGTVQLGNPSCIATSYDGFVYVGDSTSDIVLALRDQNGDGDAHDPGEYTVFFDPTVSASGIELASVQGLHVDALGRVFVATANTSTAGTDQILVLEDLNGDGDANDAGEARDYHTVPGVTALGDSIPTEVLAAFDVSLYYSEAGATGAIPKGVYRLTDANFDGDCNDPGERATFWDTSAIGAASPFHYGMAIDGNERFYLTDHSTNETVWTAFDQNGNDVIDPGEAGVFYQTPASTWWDVAVRDDGAVLLCEDQTPDRLTLLRDLNGDGDALDPGEAVEVYDDTIAANPDVRPRGAAWMRAPLLSLSMPVAQVGTTTDFVTQTNTPVELVAVVLSTGVAAPVSVPPYGVAEIDVNNFAPLGFGLSAAGSFSLPLAVPNVPTAVGTWGGQALAGDAFRLFLSNPVLLTVTP